jgi:hypothetical protein
MPHVTNVNKTENAAFFPVDRLELPPYVPRHSEVDRTWELLRLCSGQREANFLWKRPEGQVVQTEVWTLWVGR